VANRRVSGPPNQYVRSGQWPAAVLLGPVGQEEDIRAARVAQAIARRLGEVMVTKKLASHRAVTELTGVDHRIVGRVLAGDVHVDPTTLARLEATLGRLYPEWRERRGF